MIILEKLKKLTQRAREIEASLSDAAVIAKQETYQKLAKELAQLKPLLRAFEKFGRIENAIADAEKTLREETKDEEMRAFCEEELQLQNDARARIVEEMETMLLRESDPNAARDVLVEIRGGTGGEEASLFAADLFRMYSRCAVVHGLKTEVMSASATDKGGFKEIIFSVSGPNAYALLKYESGIHRVQRVPETEASGRIHTSAVTVAVLPEADEADIEIESKDLRIDVFRASGAGGQHVNKTESAVRITHIPTGVVVSCQDERSQHKNKAKAMRVLRARIYDANQQKHQSEIARQRKEQVGSGDRSAKIRTYNFPDQRITDHRIGLTLHSLDDILDGHLDPLIQALERDEREQKLRNV